MSKESEELLEKIGHYAQLQGAAQMVLDDFRLRRAQTQSEWDKQEELLRSHVQFYEGVIANFQGQHRALEQAENQFNFDALEREEQEAATTFFRASEAYLKQLEAEVEAPKRGAVTETVENMLRYAAEPVKIAQLADRLVNNKIRADRSEASEAVRSALKNLKKQGKVRPVGHGAYEHTNPQKAFAKASA